MIPIIVDEDLPDDVVLVVAPPLVEPVADRPNVVMIDPHRISVIRREDTDEQ